MKNEEDRDDYMTSKEAADFLKICVATLKKYVRAGKVPSVAFSEKVIRFRKEDLKNLNSEDIKNASKGKKATIGKVQSEHAKRCESKVNVCV